MLVLNPASVNMCECRGLTGTLEERKQQYRKRRLVLSGGAAGVVDAAGSTGDTSGSGFGGAEAGGGDGPGGFGTGGGFSGSGIAMRMMQSMGYVPGQGLGATGQGISSAIEVAGGRRRAGLGLNTGGGAEVCAWGGRGGGAPSRPREGADCIPSRRQALHGIPRPASGRRPPIFAGNAPLLLVLQGMLSGPASGVRVPTHDTRRYCALLLPLLTMRPPSPAHIHYSPPPPLLPLCRRPLLPPRPSGRRPPTPAGSQTILRWARRS